LTEEAKFFKISAQETTEKASRRRRMMRATQPVCSSRLPNWPTSKSDART